MEAPEQQPQEAAAVESAAVGESQVRDARVHVSVSPDAMQAFLSMRANPDEPYPFTLDAVVRALAERGVVAGILGEELQRVLESQSHVSDFLVAQGVLPQEGEDARVDFFFDPSPKPPAHEGGENADWREIGLIQVVTENQPLARKIPARPGSTGLTVTGKRLEPRQVRDARLPVGRGTKLNEKDPHELLAAAPGAVRVVIGQVVVDRVLSLPRDVDFAVGNVDFNGSVKIGGSVQPGFRVRATGDVHVAGCVEGATMECGESLWVSQGILGHENKTTVRAGKDIATKVARNAVISAGGNITVQIEIIHCEVESGGTVSVGPPEGKRGRIAGGRISAAMGIRSVDLGAEVQTPTILIVNPSGKAVCSPWEAEVKQRIEKLRALYEAATGQVGQLLCRQLNERESWTPADDQQMARLSGIANQTEEDLLELEGQLEAYRSNPAKSAKVAQHKVVVYGALFPGVRVTIGRATRFFVEELKRVQVVATDDYSSIVVLDL